MTLTKTLRSMSLTIRLIYGALAIGALAGLSMAPHKTAATALFVAESLIVIAPVVVPGIALAAWIRPAVPAIGLWQFSTAEWSRLLSLRQRSVPSRLSAASRCCHL